MPTLCPRLSERIISLASELAYSVADTAPSTYAELRASSVAPLVVWSGGSEHTIYGDRSVNYAFRAWHDSLHIKLNAEFSLHGEILVAQEQARILGDDTAKIILAEVIGQAEYFALHGFFPIDQSAFIQQYLKGNK